MNDHEQMAYAFARELTSALGESARGRIEVERVVLEAPQAVLARPGALRELAHRTARELRARAWKE